MKVIDLLVKIANGEDFGNKHFKYTDRLDREIDICLISKENIIYKLNEEIIELNDGIEIIEEDKKIGKIKSLNNVGSCQDLIEFKIKQQYNNIILKDKINEIIDKLNKGDKE